MGRGNKSVLKVRYRMPGKTFRTKFATTGSISRPPSKKIVSVRKVSKEEAMRVGRYLPFDPDKLLKEFKEVEENAKEEDDHSTSTDGSS